MDSLNKVIKCIVKGCDNDTENTRFKDPSPTDERGWPIFNVIYAPDEIGPLCMPCYMMLKSGKIGRGDTFIHTDCRISEILIDKLRNKVAELTVKK